MSDDGKPPERTEGTGKSRRTNLPAWWQDATDIADTTAGWTFVGGPDIHPWRSRHVPGQSSG
jgi:hypothetical protein